jgi:DNA-binding protein H-NS
MNRDALRSMSTDELWRLHEQVVATVARNILEEKAKLEEGLRRLEYRNGAVSSAERMVGPKRTRRPYPKVLPKYQNPRNPAERWSGCGKQPSGCGRSSRPAKSSSHLRIA